MNRLPGDGESNRVRAFAVILNATLLSTNASVAPT
jgi:hypothetical protein